MWVANVQLFVEKGFTSLTGVQFTCLVPGGLESLAMTTPGSKHHHYVITPATGGSMSKLFQDFMFFYDFHSPLGFGLTLRHDS